MKENPPSFLGVEKNNKINMRILFLNYEYPPLGGGAGNATEYLMREFSKDKTLSIDVIVSAVDNKYNEESLGEKIRLYRIPIGDKRNLLKSQSMKEIVLYMWRASRFSEKLAREKKYDGVHCFFTVPCGAVALWLRLVFGLPYIVSLRGSDVPGYSKKYEKLYFFIKPFVRLIWRLSTAVISNSEGLKELALTTNQKQEIGVIYNGVDTEIFVPNSREKLGKVFTILCASRLERRKGFRYVVEAVDALRERYPQLRLMIAGGDGNAGEELRSLVEEKKLSDFVKFFGQYTRDDLVRLQQEADVFVLPSFNEGMSNSLLEAMAGGLPVLMTPTGGAEELILNGENGYIIDFGESKSIESKIEILLRDKELIERMGKRSREIAETMSWKRVSEKYRRLYDSRFL